MTMIVSSCLPVTPFVDMPTAITATIHPTLSAADNALDKSGTEYRVWLWIWYAIVIDIRYDTVSIYRSPS